MKNLFLLSVIFTTLFFSCSKSKVQDPENIGKHVFVILKDLNTTAKIDYFKNFISAKDLLDIQEDINIDSIINVLSKDQNIDRNVWEKELEDKLEYINKNKNIILEKYFNDMKEDAGKMGINWDEIKYLDYTYEIKTEDYIYGKKLYNKTIPKMCVGKLYLKYKETPFYVKIEALLKDNNYELYEIRGIYD